jgi:D-beta-D-heptose 7-phosphate kinase / D-beta-D-heptose 1-phosphate adenosyltransferase
MIDLKGKVPKLLVIGDLMVDHYLWGSCERISPEAPVQVINVNNESILLGGAGNVINNLKTLGAKVDVISVIGNCNISNELKGLLNDIEIDTKFLFRQRNRITSKKSRVIASQQQVIRFDREETNEITSKSQKEVLNAYTKIIKNYDIVLLSDYGKGVLTNELTKSLIDVANKNSKKVLVDPKGKDYSKYKGAFLLTPNKNEASKATGINIQDEETLTNAIFQLKSDCDLDISIITLSDQGIAVYDNEFRIHPTFTREVFDVTGAGDTVLASLGFALACDSSIDDAIEFSNFSAGVVVGKIGSSTASINEIIDYESSLKKSTSDKHIKSIDEIRILSKELKAIGKKIVFTNGCFDVVHAGHIKYLETSKSYGDILIVGLNSNRSVSSLKGPKRPFNSELDRAYIIAALESVDFVVIFDEDTPYNLIKLIKPHILTKGADYKDKKVIGHELVKELKLVDIVEGKGTSKLVDQIQRSK